MKALGRTAGIFLSSCALLFSLRAAAADRESVLSCCQESPVVRIQSLGAESSAKLAGTLSEVADKLGIGKDFDPEFSRAFNGNYLYRVTVREGSLRLESESPDLGKPELQETLHAYERFKRGKVTGLLEPDRKLSLSQKLLLLSMAGSEDSGSGEPAKLVELSRSLGFDAVAIARDGLRFRDPLSGQIYYQSASQLFSVPSDDLKLATALGDRAADDLSRVTPPPSSVSWTTDSIRASAGYDKTTSSVKVDLSDKDAMVGLEVEKRFASGRRKGFFLSSRTEAAEGTAWVEAFGNKPSGADSGDSFFSNMLAGTGVTGYAKYDALTGKIELRRPIEDPGVLEVAGALEFKPFPIPLTAQASRLFRNDPEIVRARDGVQTAHDRISVVFDGRNSEGRAYIVNRADVYLLDGFDKASAVGFRNALTAAFPSRSIGEFAVVLDLAKVVPGDPAAKPGAVDLALRGLPVSATAKAEWRKSLSRLIEFGAEFFYRKGADPDDMFVSRFAKPERKDELAGALRLMLHF